MLSIAKLRVGQEAYQLSGVAQSLDDYYTGVGEAAGMWLGIGAERLGLDGEVDPDDLRAVLAGLAPGTGGLTPDGTEVRTHARRVPGFDLTFKTPKSVSVLYAVSDDPRVQGAIIEAGDTAVAEALAWLEREAIHVRRGSGDVAYLNDLAARDPEAAERARVRVLPGQGVVAATFRHRTSRAGDPLLHWHTLVANMVEGPDGRWSAFVHPELYRSVRAAGEVFQTVLRGELTERLGLEWRPGRHVPEIAGVPQALCDQFSKRSVEIDAWLTATGTPNDPAGRQAAVLATRRHKPETEHERFDAAWKTEALDAGWEPDHADALIASTTDRQVPGIDEVWRIPTVDPATNTVVDRVVDPDTWIATLGRALTEHDSTFTRPELVQAIAARIGEGATTATIDRITARTLACPHIIPIAGDNKTSRWTTRELLAVERRFLDRATTTQGARPGLDPGHINQILDQWPTLGADQDQAVRTLALSTDAISVMVGPAGTGKTFTLDAIRHVFEAAGQRVIGAAPSARAAHELAADAHIDASTIHRLLGTWHRGSDRPDANTLLIVDEAAMAGLRDLDHVLAGIVDAGGRVLLVGDHHQLPEVTAGGGFAALATNPDTTRAELTVNRRQHHGWERDALTELRDGHVAAAVAAYRAHDRVVVADDRAATITAGVDRWLNAHHNGQIPVLLAGTNQTVDALNTAVRTALIDEGILGNPIDGTHGELAVGERLMVRANNYHATTPDGQAAAVLNGQTGTLTAATDAGLIVRMDHNQLDVVIPHDQMQNGLLGYAYASTAHRAQGGTWDLAITVGVDGLYREAGYLVMSRGRASNWLIVTTPELDDIDAELARHDSTLRLIGEEPDTVDDQLIDRLNHSRRKTLALTRDPHTQAVDHAATTLDYPTLERWAAHAAAVEQHATHLLDGRPDQLRRHVTRTEHSARHVAVGQRVKAWDRRNIGTITAIDDTAGTVAVTFIAHSGRTATRTLGWGDVQIVEPRDPQPRQLNSTAADTLTRLVGDISERVERWDHHLDTHGVEPNDRHVYERAARLSLDRAAAHLAAAQPDWLTTLIGTRPARPAAAGVWDDTVRGLAHHRLRHAITDPAHPTDPDPASPADRTVWHDVSPAVAAARVWLDTHTTTPIVVPRTRSASELYARYAELEAIFATAPSDQRDLLDQLRHGGTLDLEDTATFIDHALATQGERRRWILEHWPHVVEYAQVTRALDAHDAAPETAHLLQGLTRSNHPELAAAASSREPWLVLLTGRLDIVDQPTLDAPTERLLAAVADYRARRTIESIEPLGPEHFHIDHDAERAVLSVAVEHAVADRGEPHVVEGYPPTQLTLDDITP